MLSLHILKVTLLVWPVAVADVVLKGNDLVVGWNIRPRREWHCMMALQVKSSDLMGRRSSLPTSVGLGEVGSIPTLVQTASATPPGHSSKAPGLCRVNAHAILLASHDCTLSPVSNPAFTVVSVSQVRSPQMAGL